jgi:predicted nucleic acid-binding Zn ribbon protein
MWSPLPDPHDDGAPPSPLAGDLDALLAHLGAPPVEAVRALQEGWSDLVGPEVAEHVRVAGIDRGTLLLEVDAPAWATRMRFGARELLGRIGSRIGSEVATRVEVQVRPRRSPRNGPVTSPGS